MGSKETIGELAVSIDILRRSNGFAMDMGGSLIKLVYLAKDEWEAASTEENSGKGSLYVTSFPRENVEEVIAFIKENVFIRRAPDPCPVIHTTGVGLNTLADIFNSELNVKVTNTLEFDGFIHSAKFLLENYDKTEVCIEQPEGALKEGVRIGRSICQTAKAFAKGTVAKWKVNEKNADEYDAYCQHILSGTFEEPHWKVEYPFLLYQMGSGFSLLKVSKDGSYEYVHSNSLAGRTFLELGRFLTGSETFEELMALAEAGHEDNLNVRVADVVSNVKGDSYTDALQSEMVIYSFGKMHGKKLEDINKADLARTLIQTICSNAMNLVHHVMHKDSIRHIFLCGSFAQADLNRRLLVKEFEVVRGIHTDRPTQDNRLHIFSHAGCMGALGAFLIGCEANSADGAV